MNKIKSEANVCKRPSAVPLETGEEHRSTTDAVKAAAAAVQSAERETAATMMAVAVEETMTLRVGSSAERREGRACHARWAKRCAAMGVLRDTP